LTPRIKTLINAFFILKNKRTFNKKVDDKDTKLFKPKEEILE